MHYSKQLLRLGFIGLCSFQLACASMTNNLAKMKESPGKLAPTGMRVNMGLGHQVYVPFLGDMNFTIDAKTSNAQVEKDPSSYRGQNLVSKITPETQAYLERLHSQVLAQFSQHLELITIEDLNAHPNFKKFSNWKHTSNNKIHLSLAPYTYPHMGTALIGGGESQELLESMFTDLGMVAGINMAYSFVEFQEQAGVAAADLNHIGPASRSIGVMLKLQGRDSTGSIILNQTFVGKSASIESSTLGNHVDYAAAQKLYDEAADALLTAIQSHFTENS